jgi:hypothetical protein
VESHNPHVYVSGQPSSRLIDVMVDGLGRFVFNRPEEKRAPTKIMRHVVLADLKTDF